MKKNMKKSLRLALLYLVVFGICITLFNIFLKTSSVTEKEVPVYMYSQYGKINYQVILRPNSIFTEKALGENQIYLLEFVNYVNTEFTYQFIGEKSAEIRGNYQIVAILEGTSRQGDTVRPVWSKEFILKPYQSFTSSDSSVSISEKIKINLEPYTSLVEEVEKETRVRLDTRLKVFMNLHINVQTQEGIIEESISPYLEIPIGETQFQISKNEVLQENTLMGTELVQSPRLPKQPQVILLLLLIGTVTYIKFYTVNAPQKSKKEREIIKIFKEHESRIVALEHDISIVHKPNYKLKNMGDLVKVADELEKPIMYVHKCIKTEIDRFFIVDETCTYSYEIKNEEISQRDDEEVIKDTRRSARDNKPKFSFMSDKKDQNK